MAIKLLILKSYEDVIAEVTEMFSGSVVVGYVLNNPYLLRLEDKNQELPTRVSFYPYAPLSKDKSVHIPCDWVVSILEPLDEIKTSYVEKVNGKSENSDIKE